MIVIFLCQNPAFCLPEENSTSTLRPPSHFNKSTEQFIIEQYKREGKKSVPAKGEERLPAVIELGANYYALDLTAKSQK